MSFALADPTFEAPTFDAARYLPFPPLGLRVALRAAQAVVYAHQQPLGKAELALAARTFASGRAFFATHYAERITAEAQFLKFKASRQ
jgi:hypothetical protein